MQIIINPGSEPVIGAKYKHAQKNMRQFLKDVNAELEKRNHTVPAEIVYHHEKEDGGRFSFFLVREDIGHPEKERKTEIEMPGIPLKEVRFLRLKTQNIWNFPRLFVDGSSWVWFYAIGAAADALTGEGD